MEREYITKAISGHKRWKERLATAIASGTGGFTPEDVKKPNRWLAIAIAVGTSDFDPEVIKLPDRCEFGKWLYGTSISADMKGSPYYQKVLDVHAQFHVEAAAILSLALQGDKSEAEKLMASGNKFDSLSTTLTELLEEWAAA
jgi:hypothetical protein